MKKFVLMFTLVIFAFAFVGCGEETTTTAVQTTADQTTADQTTAAVQLAQGVTATTITVGNTAATTGYFALVGVPFNVGIEAVFKEVNDAGGIDGRMLNLIHYDDEFDAAKGSAFTETLVEDDEVFALVGHFGTPTVGATIDYIQTIGIPMVYAATGVNSLYFEESLGNPVMAVQPIYKTDGRIMTARALTEDIYGVNGDAALASDSTIGVLYTNDDVGNSIKEGIDTELAAIGFASNRVYDLAVTVDTVDTAVQLLKAYGVSTVILAMNQGPFAYTLTSMYNQELNIPVFTTYVNADISAVDHLQYDANRPIYTNAWVDVYSEAGQVGVAEFAACIMNADLTDEEKTAYMTNSFAIAGYIAARVFVEGLTRVETSGDPLTWENYIAAMEDGAIDIPMGGTVDFSDGMRWGIASMSLLQYSFTLGDDPATTDIVETDFALETFGVVQPIQTLEEIEAN
jgi:ABC-type branched-subunit amino acid transport system substrate-binding protein